MTIASGIYAIRHVQTGALLVRDQKAFLQGRSEVCLSIQRAPLLCRWHWNGQSLKGCSELEYPLILRRSGAFRMFEPVSHVLLDRQTLLILQKAGMGKVCFRQKASGLLLTGAADGSVYWGQKENDPSAIWYFEQTTKPLSPRADVFAAPFLRPST